MTHTSVQFLVLYLSSYVWFFNLQAWSFLLEFPKYKFSLGLPFHNCQAFWKNQSHSRPCPKILLKVLPKLKNQFISFKLSYCSFFTLPTKVLRWNKRWVKEIKLREQACKSMGIRIQKLKNLERRLHFNSHFFLTLHYALEQSEACFCPHAE